MPAPLLARLTALRQTLSSSPLAKTLRSAPKHAFTAHPAQTNETYLQHLWFTVRTAVRFILVSLVLLAHGLLPFLFTHTASRHIEMIYVTMKKRIPAARREAIDDLYCI